MLQKKERLNRNDFNRFFSAGKRSHSKHFQLIFHPHSSFHASVVVSKKIAREAVRRNKLRRRVYDIVRNTRENLAVGVYIIITKKGAGELSFAEIKQELNTLLG